MSEITVEPTEKRNRFSYIIIVAVVALLGLIAWGLWQNDQTRPQVGDPAPEFEMVFFDRYLPKSLDASALSLSDLEGKVVVLNFWASWCIECRVEMPDLEGTANRYGNDVEVIGIAYLDVEDQSILFLQDYGISYANAPDLGSEISDRFFITGVPETFVIDKNGTIAASFIGPVTGEQLAAVIEPLLLE